MKLARTLTVLMILALGAASGWVEYRTPSPWFLASFGLACLALGFFGGVRASNRVWSSRFDMLTRLTKPKEPVQ